MKLTDNLCRTTKPSGGYTDVNDEGTPLTFRVKKNGERLFIWRGRIHGKQTKRVIGAYPDMTLADARLEALKLKMEAKKATPSIAPVIAPRDREKLPTVESAFDRYYKVKLTHLRTGDEIKSMIERHIYPTYRDRELRTLARKELNQFFNDKLDAGAGVGLNRVISAFKSFLKWCVTEDLIEFSPAATIQKKVVEQPRKRILRDWELASIQIALPSFGPYADAVGLLLHTCTRRADIFALRWCEVETLEDGSMELRIERTKADVGHIVPLTKQAAAFLPERPKDAEDDDRVFPDIALAPGRPFYNKLTAEPAKVAGKAMTHFTMHDFRTACTTWISDQRGRGRNRFTDRAMDMLLAHVPVGVTRKHYNMSEALDERTEMLELWSTYLESNVVKFQKDNAA